MKYYKYYPFVLIVLIVFLLSCSEDFLDKKPIARASTETFYADFSTLDATVTAAYAELCAREVFDKVYYLTIGSIPADDVEAGGESINDYPDAQAYDQFIHVLNNSIPLEEIWRYCYKGLRFTNTALERLPLIKETDPEASDVLIARRTGEMKFIRALYHFMLVQVFGGVPIADHQIAVEDFSNPRNTIKEVLTFIEDDLKEAIPLLPQKSALEQPGRASKEAAQSLLAKALLYESSFAKNYPGDERFAGCEQKWAEALSYADEVIGAIDNVNLGLVGENSERFHSWRTGNNADLTIDGFRWMFTVDGDNCMESIFEIQSVNDGLGYGVTRGNVLTVYQTVRNYIRSDGTSGSYGGWSFNCPTQYLINAFRNSDSRETNLHSVPGNETDDPRFATTVGREGDSIILMDGSNSFVLLSFSNLPTGTIGRKFESSYNEFWRDNVFTQGPFNIRLIRLADVFLLAAEAAFESGDPDKALRYVNRIRTRARNCGSTGYPQDLTAISFEDIVHERRLELACEPHRFFDLVRWSLAEKYLNGIEIVAIGGDFRVSYTKGKHEFWPIPLSELQLSKGGLVNYPAWQ